MNWNFSIAGKPLCRLIAVGALMILASASLLGQSAPRADRITQGLGASALVRMSGSVSADVRLGQDFGRVEGGVQLERLTLSTLPSAAEMRELKALAAAQQNPGSGQYHRWLTQEQFGERFGLTDGDLNKLTGWLQSQGFQVEAVAPSRNRITFTGSAAEFEQAFHTQLHRFQIEGSERIVNTSELALPRALDGVVARIGGVGATRPKAQHVKPNFTSTGSGLHYLTPADWATIYDVNPLYVAGYTGSGVHIGVLGQTYVPLDDVNYFRTAAGLGAANVTYACISSSNCTSTSGESMLELPQADLDIEWAGAVAKDATIDYIYSAASDTGHTALDALVYAVTTYQVNGEVVPLLTLSYGVCESVLLSVVGDGTLQQEIDNVLQQAQTQGQTVLSASGDAGAGCTDGSPAVGIAGSGADLRWPASSPNVVAVGGSRFSGDQGDIFSDSYWSGNQSADQISSALKYIPEKAWNDSAADLAMNPNAPLASSGGGVSKLYGRPGWQQGLAPLDYLGNQITTNGRFVPDLAFAASLEHDGYLICTPEFAPSATDASSSTGPSCVNGTFRDGADSLTQNGGTSAATASFAGVLALLVQKYGPLGNFNPSLYNLAENGSVYASGFHDITSGNNYQPCNGTYSGCVNLSVGYPAGTGYDLATGWGSMDANGFFSAYLSSVAPSLTSVAASPNPLTMGSSTTLTATVASSTSGALSGTVTFRIGNTQLGVVSLSNATSSSNGASATATLSVPVVPANGFVSGSNVVTAQYSGSGSYASSNGSVTVSAVTYVSTTVVTSDPASIALGDVATSFRLTATVSGNSGSPNGSVQFMVNKVNIGAPVGMNPGAGNIGVALLDYVTATKANGFSLGSNTVTATYIPEPGCPSNPPRGSAPCQPTFPPAPYGPSTGTATVTAGPPAYTITPSVTSLTLKPNESQKIFITLASTTYQDKVVLSTQASVTQVSPTQAGSPQVTALFPTNDLMSPGTATSTTSLSAGDQAVVAMTITASGLAANHAPALPWQAGAILCSAVLAGMPLVGRRKRTMAALLAVLTLALLMFSASCSNSRAPRSYQLQVIGTGNVVSTINITVK